MSFANSWGLYQCFQGRDEELIDPEGRADFFALDPVGKVFECISEQGDTITLEYGEQTFRVKYHSVPWTQYALLRCKIDVLMHRRCIALCCGVFGL